VFHRCRLPRHNGAILLPSSFVLRLFAWAAEPTRGLAPRIPSPDNGLSGPVVIFRNVDLSVLSDQGGASQLIFRIQQIILLKFDVANFTKP